jgi:hypothetical protein
MDILLFGLLHTTTTTTTTTTTAAAAATTTTTNTPDLPMIVPSGLLEFTIMFEAVKLL